MKFNSKEIVGYLIGIILSIIILFFSFRLWRMDLSIPLNYSGDSFSVSMFVKSTIDNGWYLNNKFLAAPFSQNLRDYPMADNLHYILMKFISFFTNEFGVVLNIYFFLLFPLTTLTSLIFFRYYKIPWVISLLSAILFSFSPYRIMRGQAHLFLSAYFLIPFNVLIILWLWDKGSIFFSNNSKNKIFFSIIITVLSSSYGIYYTCFNIFLLSIAAFSSFLRNKTIKPIISSIILSLLSIITLFINLLPYFIYRKNYGGNELIDGRNIDLVERFSLKFSQLFIPESSRSWASFFPSLAGKFNQYLISGSQETIYLGIFSIIGLIILLVNLLYKNKNELINRLSILNIFSILLGIIGGFSTIIAFVSPMLRSYGRISIYISFISVFALSIYLKTYYEKINNFNFKLIFNIFLLGIIPLGIIDQTLGLNPNITYIKEQYKSDKKFIQNIEESLPKESMVYQLPFITFPEGGTINLMNDYDLSRGYLNSDSLKWSFGPIKGRSESLWHKKLSQLPIEDLIMEIYSIGFRGIYIDRNGYVDSGKTIEASISAILKESPMVSDNKKLSFFKLDSKYFKENKLDYTSNLNDLIINLNGCYEVEKDDEQTTHIWCQKNVNITLMNPTNMNKTVVMKGKFSSPNSTNIKFIVNSTLLNDKFFSNSEQSNYYKELTIPPGETILRINSNAKKTDNINDQRKLYFLIYDFSISEK